MNQPSAPTITAALDRGFQSAALFNRSYLAAAKKTGRAVPQVIGLECERKLGSWFETLILPEGDAATLLYVERLVKFLLWSRGGWKLDIGGPKTIGEFIRKTYYLQLLGIGTDGHIGCNEQTSSLASRTRIKTLTPQTRKDNARFFGSKETVLPHVITMGIGSILKARHCLLLAFGKNKAHAIARAVEGPITSMNSASALQQHPHVTVILDQAAAAKLKLKKFYRYVFGHKPEWQKF